mmetsp:Transcript_100418/g.322085  ORF Transcript_100418/g.322085 Transcript_100418/m.322085 type:complete len:337 (-) Transcript_100418:93-1103(-)
MWYMPSRHAGVEPQSLRDDLRQGLLRRQQPVARRGRGTRSAHLVLDLQGGSDHGLVLHRVQRARRVHEEAPRFQELQAVAQDAELRPVVPQARPGGPPQQLVGGLAQGAIAAAGDIAEHPVKPQQLLLPRAVLPPHPQAKGRRVAASDNQWRAKQAMASPQRAFLPLPLEIVGHQQRSLQRFRGVGAAARFVVGSPFLGRGAARRRQHHVQHLQGLAPGSSAEVQDCMAQLWSQSQGGQHSCRLLQGKLTATLGVQKQTRNALAIIAYATFGSAGLRCLEPPRRVGPRDTPQPGPEVRPELTQREATGGCRGVEAQAERQRPLERCLGGSPLLLWA